MRRCETPPFAAARQQAGATSPTIEGFIVQGRFCDTFGDPIGEPQLLATSADATFQGFDVGASDEDEFALIVHRKDAACDNKCIVVQLKTFTEDGVFVDRAPGTLFRDPYLAQPSITVLPDGRLAAAFAVGLGGGAASVSTSSTPPS